MTYDITIEDDRTEVQKLTHTHAVVMRDKFLSGCGKARGGDSYCCWAIPADKNPEELLARIEARTDSDRVEYVEINNYRPSHRCKHFKIYVDKE